MRIIKLLLVISIVSCTRYEKEYYDNGSLKSKSKIDMDGLKDGLTISYYENGSIESEATFYHGKQIDSCRMYYQNGNILYQRFFKNDLEAGSSKYYNEDGSINKIIEYKDGIQYSINEFSNGKISKHYKRFYFNSFYDTILIGDTLKVQFGLLLLDTNFKCKNFSFLYNLPKPIKNKIAALDNYLYDIKTDNCGAIFSYCPSEIGHFGYRLAFQEKDDSNRIWLFVSGLDFYVDTLLPRKKPNIIEGLIEGKLIEEYKKP